MMGSASAQMVGGITLQPLGQFCTEQIEIPDVCVSKIWGDSIGLFHAIVQVFNTELPNHKFWINPTDVSELAPNDSTPLICLQALDNREELPLDFISTTCTVTQAQAICSAAHDLLMWVRVHEKSFTVFDFSLKEHIDYFTHNIANEFLAYQNDAHLRIV